MLFVGKKIRAARKAAGLTQAQLAEKSGVAAITIHQYEAGKRQPRMKQLADIAAALNMSVDSLITFEDEVAPGVKRRIIDNPDSDYYMVEHTADSPELLFASMDVYRDIGLLEQLIISEVRKLNTAGQQLTLNLIRQLAQTKEFQSDKEVKNCGVHERTNNG